MTEYTGGFAGADNELQFLVNLSAGGRVEMGVTLFVSGAIVSGYIISEERYFRERANSLKATDNEGLQAFGEFYDERADRAYAKAKEQEDGDEADHPVFIHLRNAKILGPHGLTPDNGMTWRCRLDRVDGFTDGVLR